MTVFGPAAVKSRSMPAVKRIGAAELTVVVESTVAFKSGVVLGKVLELAEMVITESTAVVKTKVASNPMVSEAAARLMKVS